MKAGGKVVILIIVIALALFMISKLAEGPKKVDVSEIENIEKPKGVSNLKVEKEGNTRKVTITVEDNDIEQAKEQAQNLLDTVEREEGTVFMFEVISEDEELVVMGLSLIGSNKIDWN